jgi:phospholipid/cholesterol/gamma-HCH transport system substrate-binding protein
VANSLNARIGPIADNLQRFSGSGLRDVEALVNDARRSIQRIEQSITSIERDPQRLLFGGDTVKQYDGRNRR